MSKSQALAQLLSIVMVYCLALLITSSIVSTPADDNAENSTAAVESQDSSSLQATTEVPSEESTAQTLSDEETFTAKSLDKSQIDISNSDASAEMAYFIQNGGKTAILVSGWSFGLYEEESMALLGKLYEENILPSDEVSILYCHGSISQEVSSFEELSSLSDNFVDIPVFRHIFDGLRDKDFENIIIWSVFSSSFLFPNLLENSLEPLSTLEHLVIYEVGIPNMDFATNFFYGSSEEVKPEEAFQAVIESQKTAEKDFQVNMIYRYVSTTREE